MLKNIHLHLETMQQPKIKTREEFRWLLSLEKPIK